MFCPCTILPFWNVNSQCSKWPCQSHPLVNRLIHFQPMGIIFFYFEVSCSHVKVRIIEKSMSILKPQSCDWHDYRQLTDKAGPKFQGKQYTLFEKPLLLFSISKWKQLMVIFLAHFYSNLFCLCLYFLLHPNKYFWYKIEFTTSSNKAVFKFFFHFLNEIFNVKLVNLGDLLNK